MKVWRGWLLGYTMAVAPGICGARSSVAATKALALGNAYRGGLPPVRRPIVSPFSTTAVGKMVQGKGARGVSHDDGSNKERRNRDGVRGVWWNV